MEYAIKRIVDGRILYKGVFSMEYATQSIANGRILVWCVAIPSLWCGWDTFNQTLLNLFDVLSAFHDSI